MARVNHEIGELKVCTISSSALLLVLAVPLGAAASPAAAPHVLPAGQSPPDSRLGELRSERGDFLFAPAASQRQWAARADEVRKIARVYMGLWPLPRRHPLNAVIHGKLELDGYTVEKVFFESVPGFYVTGNLYRPSGAARRRPAVLSPHGHFPGGRFQDEGPQEVQRKIEVGAERYADGGRSFMQSRCVQLARMGCVVFHYDMIGYADSTQIPLPVAHKFSRARIQLDQPPPRGLYSAAALLHLHNSLGLHTFNSIRALDFLTSLPDVDPARIAVTGGSGGGTQTFMLCAVDDRPLVAVPVVIVSTTRQGGCTCENICGFRIGTTNLELTALHAPKPLLLVSADDATRTMPQRGFPLLQHHYRQLGAPSHVAHAALLQFPHNYNYASRREMYHWVNRHLALDLPEPIVERPYRRLGEAELTVWSDDYPQPKADPEFEPRLLDQLAADAAEQLAQSLPQPNTPDSLQAFQDQYGEAWRILLRRLPDEPQCEFTVRSTIDHGTHREVRGLLRYLTVDGHRAALPIVRLQPHGPPQRSLLWVDGRGKACLFDAAGQVPDLVTQLLARQVAVVGVDLLYQGEFLPQGVARLTRTRWLTGEQAFGGWTYCYNLPIVAHRAHDVMAAGQWLRSEGRPVDLLAWGGAAPQAIAAAAQAPGTFGRVAVDTERFRFSNVADIYAPDFLPGSAKYGDLPCLLALCSPGSLWVAGESDASLRIARAAYSAAGKSEQLAAADPSATSIADAIRWMLPSN